MGYPILLQVPSKERHGVSSLQDFEDDGAVLGTTEGMSDGWLDGSLEGDPERILFFFLALFPLLRCLTTRRSFCWLLSWLSFAK
jgi:hypothetical protein